MMMMMMVGVEEFVVCGVEFIGSDRVKRHREGSRFQVFVGCAKTNRKNTPAARYSFTILLPGLCIGYEVMGVSANGNATYLSRCNL